MVRRFVDGVITGRRAEAASAVSFPLRVNRSGRPPLMVGDRSRLYRLWPTIFGPAYVSKLRTIATHDLFTRNAQAMIGNGETWFDEKGAVSVNPPRVN